MSWRVAAVLALVSWGAFAFGAVYPWAYWPLFGGCVLVGASALRQPAPPVAIGRPLAIALTGLGFAIALQLVPISTTLLRRLSPDTDSFLRRYEIGYPFAVSHPLSIDPAATTCGLAAMIMLGVFLLGLRRAMGRRDAVNLA